MVEGAVQVVVVPVVGDTVPPLVAIQGLYETTVPSLSAPEPVSRTVLLIATEEAPDIEQVGALLQVWEEAPTQLAPPQAGDGFVHVLVWLPPTHAPQADQPPATAPQGCVALPEQAAPLHEGVGLLHVRLWLQLLHVPQADQPPFTGLLVYTQVLPCPGGQEFVVQAL